MNNEAELAIKNSKENIFFKDLIRVMKNDSFRKFYNEYFNDWSDTQVMIFYMKLYSVIEKEYLVRFSEQISDDVMSWSLYKIMDNNNMRQMALKLFKNYKNDIGEIETVDTLNFCKQITFISW
jgi:hypothetical protein